MYSKYGIMDSIAQLNLPLTVRNNRTVLNIGEDFFIYDVTKQKIPSDPFKINMYVCHICLCGESKGKINLSPYDIESDMMAINIPGQIVEQEVMSEDYHGLCILMSERFVSGLGLPYNYQTYMALQECPILKLQQGQMDAMLTYCAMVRKLFKVHHPNKVEVIKHLTCAFLYGMGYYFHRLMASRKLTKEEILMQKFSMEVEQNYRKERKVLFYADLLHLSAGYLSTIIKRCSGKSAAEWIDDYVILEAKALLRSTNLTIQQISYELNFPSQSFFGKYFKRLTGMSPKEYKENRYTEKEKAQQNAGLSS